MTTEEKKKVLLIEDDRHIAEGLRLNLELQGYAVSIAASGTEGLRQWKNMHPDLIVLDIMLPGIDGLSVLQSIRLEDEQLPILILSAKTALEDKIKGLALGVDDYLTKPFQLEEFLLRANRLLVRAAWSKEKQVQAEGPSTFIFGDNRIDFKKHTATCGQTTIQLTEQEIKLIKLFINNKGKVLPRSKLLEIGWGYSGQTHSRTVDNFIVRLRRYFENDPRKPRFFKSIRSIGYLFDPGENG